MRSRNLKMALIASALVVNASGDSVMLPVAHTSASDRDDVPVARAPRAQKLAGADDEERVYTFLELLKRIIYSSKNTQDGVQTTEVASLQTIIIRGMSAIAIFDELEVGAAQGNRFADASWMKWTYCVSNMHNTEKVYKVLITTMADKFGCVTLAKKLLDAAAIIDEMDRQCT